jgi:hypothetical protein
VPSCALLKPVKCHFSNAHPTATTIAAAVDHNAAMCIGSLPPCSPANNASPAQNDGSIGVIGDCKVAKNAVTSGIDSTRNSRSG